MSIEKTLIILLRYVVCGQERDEDIEGSINIESFDELYDLSKKHDMAHIVSKALSDLGLLGSDDVSEKFIKQQMLAIYRYERINFELNSICKTLEKACIKHLPLKGSVLRQYYSEPWMRTSCDIDILVENEQLDLAVECLQNKLKYVFKEKSPHDVSLYSPSGVHLELHHRLVEQTNSKAFEEVMSKVWEYTCSEPDFNYKMCMTPAMFYYYHIAHMAKHFTSGGCGIKPILDLWILEHRAGFTINDAADLLEQGGLLKFAQAAQKLAEVWFSCKESDEVSEQMEEYILFGGVYGNSENRIAVTRAKKSGKIRYVVRKIFLPFNTIRMYYPILEKYAWLMPFCQIHRWLRLIFCGGIKKSITDIKMNNSVSEQQIENAATLLTRIGL